MLYSVKNVVEGFEEIDYNDGVRTLFLYTDGEYGVSKRDTQQYVETKFSMSQNTAGKFMTKYWK